MWSSPLHPSLGGLLPVPPKCTRIGPHIFVFLFLLYFLTLVEHLQVWVHLLRESHWVLAYFLGSLVGYRILGWSSLSFGILRSHCKCCYWNVCRYFIVCWWFFSSNTYKILLLPPGSWRVTPICSGVGLFLFIMSVPWQVLSTWQLLSFGSGNLSYFFDSSITPHFLILSFWNSC